MAQVRQKKPVKPTEIKKFLGINENVDGGEFNLKLGEASYMRNFKITGTNQLKKREGYTRKFNLGSTLSNWESAFWDFDSWTSSTVQESKIMGMWYGKLNGITFFLFVHGGFLYAGNLTTGVKTQLGTLTNAPTRFIQFGNKVYLNNGYEYKSFDGTNFITVAGYRPKIAIGTPPSGGGTLYEQINVLTGAKHQTFTPSGNATVYQLAETNITSVDFVYVNGVLKTVTTDYTVDLTNGTVTFVVGPSGNVNDSVDIGWTKGTGQRSLIEKCRFAMDYSGQTDSRLFLWGNADYKNRRFWSGLANGVPSAEYFEANSYDDLGTGEYAITDIVKQYDRQKIYLGKGAMYSYYTTQTLNGVDVASFPVFELNEDVGNIAEGQTQIVNNMPFTLDSGVRAWQSTNVRDQSNETLISQRVQDTLIQKDLSTAVTVHWKEQKEYWCNLDGIVYIYNYLNDTWYIYDNIYASCFLVIEGELYFGSIGAIYKFDTTKNSDNGVLIVAKWEMGFYDFNEEWLTKYMNNVWLSIYPDVNSSVEVQTSTNNEGLGITQTITHRLANFTHANFAHWSFKTIKNPQPYYLEVQAMGFCYFKIILKNSSISETVTVLSINMPARYGGKVR